MTSYIVFGASGFVGSHITATLSGEGETVLGLCSRDADLSDTNQTLALAKRLPRNAVWVITAVTRPKTVEETMAAAKANIRLAENVAALAIQLRPVHLIFLSSIDVYGRENLQLPLSETSALQPRNPYAVSKIQSEEHFTTICHEKGIPLTLLRLPGVYGPGDSQWGPVRSFVRAALRNEPITVQGGGWQRRDLLFVDDMPQIVRAVVEEKTTGLYNAVTGHTLSLDEMLAVIQRLANHALQIRYEPEPPGIDIVFEYPRLLQQLSHLILTPLEKGIGHTYTYYTERGEVP